MQQMTIRRVSPLSLAKIMGFMYAALGLIIGAFISLLAMAGAFAAMGADAGVGAGAFGMFLGVGSIVIFPICYGLMGLIGGAIAGWVYNLLAGVVGGVQVDAEVAGARAAGAAAI